VRTLFEKLRRFACAALLFLVLVAWSARKPDAPPALADCNQRPRR
jgi:hypothetical protein